MTRCTKNTIKLSVSDLSDKDRKGFVNAYFASEAKLSDFARNHGLNYKTFVTTQVFSLKLLPTPENKYVRLRL